VPLITKKLPGDGDRCQASAEQMRSHASIVADISAAVKQFHKSKTPFRISHGSTNSTRQNVRAKPNVVDVSSLNRVLSVDPSNRTALVEPNVPMDLLVASTIKHGLVPPVVMEFPGITAGGGFAGTAGESSSFKHGFFDRTVNWVEMVLADGKILKVMPEKDKELFDGAAGAVGSLGITTLLELQLEEAKPYVEATYYPVESVAEAVAKVKELITQQDLDYVDGILFSPSCGAIVTGKMTSTLGAKAKPQTFSNPWDPWFYMHVEKCVRSSGASPTTETIPLAEYLFRYDRGGFWVGRSAFSYWHFPFNRFTRWFLDDFLHTRMLYRALHASGQSQRYVVQDLALPYDSAEEFVNYTQEKFDIWPLWLCPLKQGTIPTFHPHLDRMDSRGCLEGMLNVGLWGFGPKNRDQFVALNRDLEGQLKRLGGMKWFYAQTYYTEQEFWSIYNKPWYNGLRAKYNAMHLPSVLDKVRVDVENERKLLRRSWGKRLLHVWPLAGIWGIWKSILSGDWKIPKRTKIADMEVSDSAGEKLE
jgi:delta24-sterol reductase